VTNPPSSICNIGLGCVTFGREIDEESAFAMMDHAVANRITLFDTAAAYGGGGSESIVGKWLVRSGLRERVTIATKILPPYTPDAMEASVEASRQRLGIASIDLLFLHRWDATAENEKSLRTLDRLVRSGRVQRIGASNFTAVELGHSLTVQTELGLARFRALQNIHNFAVRGIDDASRRLCARDGIEIITYSPLGAGFLTGKHEDGVRLGSRFDIIPGHQNVYFNDAARHRLARLRTVASHSGRSMIELALVWALRQPQVGTVLVGGRSPAHLDQAFQARTFPDLELLRELDQD
jgi:aryl-alcohol dehydrogenase-like predicted oxidoreductase